MFVSSHRTVLREKWLELCMNMLPEYQLCVRLYVRKGVGGVGLTALSVPLHSRFLKN